MTTAATIPPTPARLSRAQIVQETSFSLAADLIERGLKSSLAELHHLLIQVADSGLLPEESDDWRCVERLTRKADSLMSQAVGMFPASTVGAAAPLKHRLCKTLVQEVDFYRQEQFWTKKDRASFIQSEDLITEMFRLYAEAEWVLQQLDAEQPNDRPVHRVRAPQRMANPYEDIFGLRAAPHHHD